MRSSPLTVVTRPQLTVACLLLAAASAACAGPLQAAPQHVRTAIEPFRSAGYACAGPSTDNSRFEQWRCDLSGPDGISTSVVIDADGSGIKQVLATVDASKAGVLSASPVTEFFSRVCDIQVAGSPVDAKAWVLSHIPAGGQEHVGALFITLDPLAAVTHLVLFVPD